jgi:hypothetical protein
VNLVLLDCNLLRSSSRHEGFRSGNPNLRGITSGAERSAVFDVCSTFVARMFH